MLALLQTKPHWKVTKYIDVPPLNLWCCHSRGSCSFPAGFIEQRRGRQVHAFEDNQNYFASNTVYYSTSEFVCFTPMILLWGYNKLQLVLTHFVYSYIWASAGYMVWTNRKKWLFTIGLFDFFLSVWSLQSPTVFKKDLL